MNTSLRLKQFIKTLKHNLHILISVIYLHITTVHMLILHVHIFTHLHLWWMCGQHTSNVRLNIQPIDTGLSYNALYVYRDMRIHFNNVVHYKQQW